MLCVVLLGLGACSSEKKDPPADGGGDALQTWQQAPPWPLADRQAERIAKAGLPALTREGTHVHFHSHLDVFYNGEAVKVPNNVGIDFDTRVISPLHTHYDSGIIHVEAEVDEPVTLGMFLTEWGVRNDANCIADICDAANIRLFVNGEEVKGPSRLFVITPNLQIALVLGTPPEIIPSTYDCSANPQDACDEIPQPNK